MNTLSILIYAGSVVGSIKILLVAFATLMIFGIIGMAINYANVMDDSNPRYSWGDEKTYQEAKNGMAKLVKITWIPVVLPFVSALIPNQETIYLIAGSEVGQQVIQTQEAQEVYQSIKDILFNLANQNNSK